ncbi:MAG: hypothetical protein IJM30_10420 [Thermoguttaceae bacterium]|nr:hypothetical protein [Thermoguttaceae bacterium]
MRQELLKNAVVGDPKTPWKTLLGLGADALRDASLNCPKETGRDERVFFPPDERESLSLADADYLLKTKYFRFALGTGKRFPAARVKRLLNNLMTECVSRDLSDEELDVFCGNAGRLLVFVSRNDDWKRGFPPFFQYEPMNDETLVRETTRAVKTVPSPVLRRGALEALRDRDPAKGRELMKTVWKGSENDDPKKLQARRAELLPAMRFGLGKEDEPFLEDALATGNVAAVREAVKALALLRNSSVWKTLRALGDGVLTPEGEFAPPEYSKELKKLGFPKCEGEELGIRILGAIPNDYWEKRFGKSAKKFVELMPFSPKTAPIYAGRLISIVEFGANSDWFRAIAPVCAASWSAKICGPTIKRLLVHNEVGFSNNETADNYSAFFLAIARIVDPEAARICYLWTSNGMGFLGRRDPDNFGPRIMCEPTPWSDKFCQEYYQWAFEDPDEESAYSKAQGALGNPDMFPRQTRAKIVAEYRARWEIPKSYERSGREAATIAKKIDEGERRFGEYHLGLRDRDLVVDRNLEDLPHWIRVWAKSTAR